jgi:hypothetical protein
MFMLFIRCVQLIHTLLHNWSCVITLYDILWPYGTLHKNKLLHQLVLSYILVQLLVHELYSCCKTLMVIKGVTERCWWVIIFINMHLLVDYRLTMAENKNVPISLANHQHISQHTAIQRRGVPSLRTPSNSAAWNIPHFISNISPWILLHSHRPNSPSPFYFLGRND